MSMEAAAGGSRATRTLSRSGAAFRRVGRLELRLVIVTVLVLVSAFAFAFFELATREHTKLILAKKNAASMVIQLLAVELGPAVDFGDPGDVAARLGDVRANADIVTAAVWTDLAKPPIASWSTPNAPALAVPSVSEAEDATWSSDFLVVTRAVKGPNGDVLGRVRLMFTLRPENEAFRRDRVQLFWTTAGLGAFIALLLGVLARRYVTGPVGRLARAATRLAEGDMLARVDVGSDDEIGDLSRAFNVMGEAVAFRQQQLQKEVELAQRIQTSILPNAFEVEGLEISCTMVSTSEVGGDYYDVLPVEGGAWLGIGDVAGHGLDAGLMMLMIQSIVASLVTMEPAAPPSRIVCALNQVLYDNVHKRLRRDDHATLTAFRYDRSGRLVFAGAHEDILVYRAESKTVTTVSTPGTWIGARRDIRRGTVDSTLELSDGDVVLLHTDGATEIRNDAGEQFGLDRLVQALSKIGDREAVAIRDDLLGTVRSWGKAEDDITLVVLRYRRAAQD